MAWTSCEKQIYSLTFQGIHRDTVDFAVITTICVYFLEIGKTI